MIPEYAPEPRYGDACENLKATMCGAYIYELLKEMGETKMANWYGIEGIKFEWRGPMSDPLLHYMGHTFCNWDIEDALWECYTEDGGNPDNDSEWVAYVTANAVDYLDNLIFEIWGE